MSVDYNEVFPETISQGATGGPQFLTDVVRLRSGKEYRNTPWADPLRSYDVGLGIRSLVDLNEYTIFNLNNCGMLKTFKFKDWSDYNTTLGMTPHSNTDQTITIGDGVSYYFFLYKDYGGIRRQIVEPKIDTLVVAFDGVTIPDFWYFFDTETGAIVFYVVPELGVEVTWGGEFYVPVRFSSDYAPITVELFNSGFVPNLSIEEQRSNLVPITDETYSDIVILRPVIYNGVQVEHNGNEAYYTTDRS